MVTVFVVQVEAIGLWVRCMASGGFVLRFELSWKFQQSPLILTMDNDGRFPINTPSNTKNYRTH